MHGTPSGLDNTICAFGSVVKFYKGREPTQVDSNSTINVLVVNSGVSRSTAKVVKQVAELREQMPQLIGSILDAMGILVEEVVEVSFEFSRFLRNHFQ